MSTTERTCRPKCVRRVTRFNPEIVQMAIEVNNPTKIVLNHLDCLCIGNVRDRYPIIHNFVHRTETFIKRNIEYLGFGLNLLESN